MQLIIQCKTIRPQTLSMFASIHLTTVAGNATLPALDVQRLGSKQEVTLCRMGQWVRRVNQRQNDIITTFTHAKPHLNIVSRKAKNKHKHRFSFSYTRANTPRFSFRTHTRTQICSLKHTLSLSLGYLLGYCIKLIDTWIYSFTNIHSNTYI